MYVHGSATMRRARAVGCAVIIGCVILLVSCGLSAMAVQQRLVAAPVVRLQLGPYRLVASTMKRPVCPPNQEAKPAGLPCWADSFITTEDVYVVWLFRAAQPGGKPEIAEQLLSLPLR
jgi:hypothetical protein